MHTLELSCGAIEYDDVGTGHPIVFIHGVWMGPSQWGPVVDLLRGEYRCIRPLLPLGAHRLPMPADADLSLAGLTRLVAETLERLELDDATLVFNDWCCAPLLVATDGARRVGRLVLASVETADNYPPGLPGRLLALGGRLPGGLTVPSHLFRYRWFRRLPMTFGRMSLEPVADDVFDSWFGPGRADHRIRADLRRYILSTRRGKQELNAATAHLSRFDRPVLVLWGAGDRVMPIESGRRLASQFLDGRFVEVPDSATLLPLEQPAAVAAELCKFVAASARDARS